MTSTAPDIQMLPPLPIQTTSHYNPPVIPHSFKNFSSNDLPLNTTSNSLSSPENVSKRHQWEKDFSHNWNILKNPSLLIEMESLSLQSTEDLQPSQSQTPTEQTEEITPLISPKINTNFNFMRNLIICIDLSKNSDKVDFKPNRQKYLLTKISSFINDYFKNNIASAITIISNKNYISEIISPFSYDASFILKHLHFQFNKTPSGYFSLTNTLLLALECIMSNNDKMNNDILILTTSPNSFDRDDIYKQILILNELKTEVNILTLDIPYDLLTTVTKLTQGVFVCGNNPDETNDKVVDEFFSYMVYKKTNKENILISLAGVKVSEQNIFICSCHKKIVSLAYTCKGCNDFYCKLPYYCRHCYRLNVNMSIVHQLKQDSGRTDNNNNITYNSNNKCNAFKLKNYYLQYSNDVDMKKLCNVFNVRLCEMHEKDFKKETKIQNVATPINSEDVNYDKCYINYQVKFILVYLKFKCGKMFNNIIKNYKAGNVEELVNETKVFLLKHNVKCNGCDCDIEIKDVNEMKRVFIFSQCLDVFCEKCYRFILEHDIGCICCGGE